MALNLSLQPEEHVARTSRWTITNGGSLVASWAGQSLSFVFSGVSLKLRVGSATERKDRDNGGTPMIAVIQGDTQSTASTHLDNVKTFDPQPGDEIVVVDSLEPAKTTVQLVLIDWASVFELEALIIDPAASVEPLRSSYTPIVAKRAEPFLIKNKSPSVLFIGDSISCGLVVAKPGANLPMPHGCLDAFPYVTQRLLAAQRKDVANNLLAYPGWAFVSPTPTEEEANLIPSGGMAEKFWKMGPWSPDSWDPTRDPVLSAVVVALGTNDDCIPHISPERFANDLSELLNRLLDSASKIYMIPPWIDANEPYHTLSNAFETVVYETVKKNHAGHQVYFCNIVQAVGENTVDGIHPDAAGHQLVAEQLAKILSESNIW